MEGNKLKIDKTSKAIIIGFVLYAIVVLAIFLPGYLSRKGTLYIVTSSFKIKYKDGKWSNIVDKNEYITKEFDIYESDSYLGEFDLLNTDSSMIYYGDKDSTKHSDNIFAYRGSKSLELLHPEITNKISDSDNAIISEALINENINYNGDINLFSRMSIDLDNDGNDEYIYYVSNYYQNNVKEYFYLFFMYKNNKVYTIEKVVADANDIYDYRIFGPYKIIDFKKDGKYELIYTGNYPNGSNDSECVKLYNLNKNKIIKDFCE